MERKTVDYKYENKIKKCFALLKGICFMAYRNIFIKNKYIGQTQLIFL